MLIFNEDESEAMVFERYRDADAAIQHFSNISEAVHAVEGVAGSSRADHGLK